MPIFRNYTAQTSPAGAPQGRAGSSVDFGGESGEAMERAGRQGMQTSQSLLEAQERRDVLQQHRDAAQVRLRISEQLEEMRQSGDPIGDKAQELLEKELSPLQEARTTRRGRLMAQQQSSVIAGEMLAVAREYDASLAGEQAESAVKEAQEANGILLQKNPTLFENILAEHKLMVESLNVQDAVKDALLQDANRTAAINAARGVIRLSPSTAKEVIEQQGKFDAYLTPDDRKQLLGEIDTAERAQRIEQERLKKQAKAQEAAALEDTQNDLLSDFAQGGLTTEQILNSNLKPFGSGSKSQFLAMVNRANEEPEEGFKTDPALFQQLWSRIHLPDGHPNKLTDENELNAYFGNGLTVSDVNTLRTEVQGGKTIEGSVENELKDNVATIAKNRLTKSNPITGIQDPIGDTQYQKFMTFYLQEYQRQINKGKSPIELTDPNSPDYLGRYIEDYARSPTQILRDLVRFNTDDQVEATPAPEGVTQAEWDAMTQEQRDLWP